MTEVSGKNDKTLKQLCIEKGVPLQEVRYRLSEGMPLEEALDTKCHTYTTSLDSDLPDLCSKLGISFEKVKRGLEGGDSLLTALSSCGCIYYQGYCYTGFTALTDDFDTTKYSLKKKLLVDGLSLEAALWSGRRNGVTYNGVFYNSERGLCEDLGISLSIFRKLQKQNLSIEETVGLAKRPMNRGDLPEGRPRMGRPIPITYNDVSYRSCMHLCEELGYPYKRVVNALGRGSSLEKVIKRIDRERENLKETE